MKLKTTKNRFYFTTLLLLTNFILVYSQKNGMEKKLIGKWCLIESHQTTCETLPSYFDKCEMSITFDSLMICNGLFGYEKNNNGTWCINQNVLIIKTKTDIFNYKLHFLNDTTFRIIYVFGHIQDSNRTFRKQH